MINVYALQKGTVKSIKPTSANLKRLVKNKTKCWVDMEGPSGEEVQLIKEVFKLHPLVADDMKTHHTRTKVEEYESYIFLVTYGLSLDDSITSHEFDFILGKNYVISSHHASFNKFGKLSGKTDLLQKRLSKGVDYMLHLLLDILIDNYSPALEKLEDIVEDLEEEATRNPDPEVSSKILKIKRKIIRIKRITFALREHTGMLAKGDHEYISKFARAYYRDLYDHAIRAADQIDSYREIIAGAHEAYMSSLSNRMNEVMKVLSIIATIMLPLSFLTGLYGMNFIVMPGLHNPNGFWYMVSGMVVLALGMLAIFKYRKWI